ncbi:MAG: lipocalin-like domain-containing protein [Pseudomonadales bacterium]
MNRTTCKAAKRRCSGAVIVTAVSILFYVCACSEPAERNDRLPMSVSSTLSDANTQGFRKAFHPRTLRFPRDHGIHPDYKNEWWYFTGNVQSNAGREFGFQFTLFRSALTPETKESDSAWSSPQIFLAHVALSDIESGELLHSERFSRGALGLAGVQHAPFRIWLNDWQVSSLAPICSKCFDNALSVKTDKFSLHLRLSNAKKRVLQGNEGHSAKSATPGNASYYYSYTRLKAQGEISLADKHIKVSGESWFDHEWSTSALETDQAGWDWFSLQLSNQSEMMLYRVRHKHDQTKNHLRGSLIAADGKVRQLGQGDFQIRATSTWTSPISGVRYPSSWELRVPSVRARLTVRPKMPDQEMRLSFRYWEGAVNVSGGMAGMPVSGNGYAELAGYGQ